MNITEERRAIAQQTPQEQRPEAAAPQRHTDWISYATAVTQSPQNTSKNPR